MPRIKSATTPVKPKTTRAVKRPTNKSVKSLATSSKKVKRVIVDVIEDEPLEKLAPAGRNYHTPAVLEEEYFEDDDQARKDDVGQGALRTGRGRANPSNLDQQKKFFSELVSEIKTKKGGSSLASSTIGTSTNKGDKKRNRPSVGLYRRFVIKFLVLLGILALLVFYFFFSKLTVYITPNGETINDSLLLKVDAPTSSQTASSTDQTNLNNQTDPRSPIAGEIRQITTSVEQTFSASGEEFTGEEIVGQVQIINNYNKSQALVATTRILSPDNKLFRLQNAVNVPAGGEVSVAIYADKPSAELAINPTTFTIPGLWLGLQDKIYARSDKAFSFDRKIKKYVKSSDIDLAVREINDALIKQAKAELNSSLAADQTWLYNTSEPATVTVNAKVGEEKDSFSAKATGQISAVSFSKDEAAKLAGATLNLLIPDNKELIDWQPANIVYSLEDFNSSTDSATIKASFSGTMILKRDSQIIDRAQLVNLSAAQLTTFLKSQPEIKTFSLKFSPSFIQKAPRLVDRIKIVIGE